MLLIDALIDLALVLFAKKFSFASQGGLTPQNAPFWLKWLKMAPLSLYLQNRPSDFKYFCTDAIDRCPD